MGCWARTFVLLTLLMLSPRAWAYISILIPPSTISFSNSITGLAPSILLGSRRHDGRLDNPPRTAMLVQSRESGDDCYQRFIHAWSCSISALEETFQEGSILRGPARTFHWREFLPISHRVNDVEVKMNVRCWWFGVSQTTYKTEMGQLVDLITAPEDHVDLSKFSLER